MKLGTVDHMKPATRHVIQGVTSILGYTELHPETVEKINIISGQLNSFQTRIKEYDAIIEGVRGFNMDDVQKMIEASKREMLSEVREAMAYIGEIQESVQ